MPNNVVKISFKLIQDENTAISLKVTYIKELVSQNKKMAEFWLEC
jgi:hypothetical protein